MIGRDPVRRPDDELTIHEKAPKTGELAQGYTPQFGPLDPLGMSGDDVAR